MPMAIGFWAVSSQWVSSKEWVLHSISPKWVSLLWCSIGWALGWTIDSSDRGNGKRWEGEKAKRNYGREIVAKRRRKEREIKSCRERTSWQKMKGKMEILGVWLLRWWAWSIMEKKKKGRLFSLIGQNYGHPYKFSLPKMLFTWRLSIKIYNPI